MPDNVALKKVRQEIDYNWEAFRKILSTKNFKGIYSDLYQGDDARLQTTPKGYDKDNEAMAYLKLKCFIAEAKIADEELLKSSLHKKTVAAFEALQPLLCFINEAIAAD